MTIKLDFQTLYDVTRKNPHRSLYLAVILQAVLDMTKPEETKESSDIRLQRDQAHAWVLPVRTLRIPVLWLVLSRV